MIIQCEACQTRFRLADEKVKPGGIKVRCSKCKEVFAVMPPEPEPPEEKFDFDSFNMEKVTDESADTTETPAAPKAATAGFDEQQITASVPGHSDQRPSAEADEGASDNETDGETGPAEESGDDVPRPDTTSSPVSASFESDDLGDEAPGEQQEAGGPVEFDFTADSETENSVTFEFFSAEQSTQSDFSFDDENVDVASGSEDTNEVASSSAFAESSTTGEFSFDDENPFDEDSAEWDDDTAVEETSFDFDEPQFDADDTRPESGETGEEDGGLQFGEIDFADGNEETTTSGLQTDTDFSRDTLNSSEQPESFSQRQQSSPSASRNLDDDKLLRATLPAKKSSLSRILFLLVLLLIVLGGAAGFLYLQEGTLNLSIVSRYLPFLRDYIGEPQSEAPGDRISIKINGSSYINGKAGQMLVIQGEAVNNHSSTRSAITIKGILLDAQGKTLLQQTVFCGNKLSESALRTLPFTAIEEAMNNQFGDSLSNMNVAAGASIPFTIVFRNLPAGVANINVEVVDSKPGAG
ncbi:MAG: DUF3426 domain-containing protein [Desulfuromonadales bacterium]